MATNRDNRSYLVKLKICNLGCIGPEGLEVSLNDIVCLVGANNTGKSTVLRAYEAAVNSAPLGADEFSTKRGEQPTTVELWVHIPENTGNIDDKWKEKINGMLLVRSRWIWTIQGSKPIRQTWDPEAGEYADDGKAAGLDSVFNSRLPRPFRIGSLDNPEEEHKKLLTLVLEPIQNRLAALMTQEESPLREKLKALQTEAEKPVTEFKADLEQVQNRVNRSYQRVFSSSEIRLTVSLGELDINPSAALTKSSHVGVVESHGQTRWSQQGTGSQRALFWSMLEVRSELNILVEERKKLEKEAKENAKELKKLREKLQTLTKPNAIEKCKADIKAREEIDALKPGGTTIEVSGASSFLPGYMLLIDEPETALHPAAIRAAKEHLYVLAAESGWQVMLSTHHPAFVDPLKDHTTIVRLHRPEANASPNIYRTDTANFESDEKATLKSLLAFDLSVAEMFFSNKVIIVEGDTEFAAFSAVMESDPQVFPLDRRPLILRARGKWTIALLVRMLAHFKVPCAVLHDVDSPTVGSSGRANPAYTANSEIVNAIRIARESGVHIIHRCSTPNFELQHKMVLPQKDKPFKAWKAVREDASIRSSVRAVFDDLFSTPNADASKHPEDGQHFEAKCKIWAEKIASNDSILIPDATDGSSVNA